MKVHRFDSTGEAYDASQTSDDIHDGDVLSVPSEGVVGILVSAWPTAVGERYGEFHQLAYEVEWDEVPRVEGGTQDYSESLKAAVNELDAILMEGAERAWQRETEATSERYEDLGEREREEP